METNIYRIAEHNFALTTLYNDVHQLCKAYLTSGIPEFHITISESDIQAEREIQEKNAVYEGKTCPAYTDGYMECLAAQRKLSEWLIEKDILLVHGSSLSLDGNGYLFSAKSGTGKSTHSRMWREVYGDRVIMINDDKPFLHIGSEGVTVYGNPWDGKHHLSTNTSVPLKGFCVLERGIQNEIRRMTSSEVYTMLLQQTYRPSSGNKLQHVFDLLDILCHTVPMYRLKCNISHEAALCASKFMSAELDD